MTAVLAPTEQLVAVVYVSSAIQYLDESQIMDLLTVSRQRNEKNNITGMLLYREGNFLQVLEGPASAVDETLKRIKRDPRHRGLILMSRKNIEERQFKDWRMAFRNMSKDRSKINGYSPFLEPTFKEEQDDELDEESLLTFCLLRRFKEDMR